MSDARVTLAFTAEQIAAMRGAIQLALNIGPPLYEAMGQPERLFALRSLDVVLDEAQGRFAHR